MLPCVCSVIDHRRRIKDISDTLGYVSCATFLFLPHFDAIRDLLLNRRTVTWNLFVKHVMNTLEFYSFDVKITYSNKRIYEKRIPGFEFIV